MKLPVMDKLAKQVPWQNGAAEWPRAESLSALSLYCLLCGTVASMVCRQKPAISSRTLTRVFQVEKSMTAL